MRYTFRKQNTNKTMSFSFLESFLNSLRRWPFSIDSAYLGLPGAENL